MVLVTIDLPLTTKCIGCGAERGTFDGTLLFDGKTTMVVQGHVPCGCGERRFRIEIGDDAEEASPSTKDVRRLKAGRV